MNEIYVEILNHAKGMWRHRWLAVICAWLTCVVGWAIVVMLPDQYESEARIYVDTRSLLAPLLAGLAVETDVGNEVLIMQRTLLSRPNMEQVMRMNDLDLEADTPEKVENLVNKLADRISIEAQTSNLFRIGFSNTDPKLAQSVVQSILTIFVENNLGRSRTDMESALSFIEKQAADYERQLQAAEERRAEFMVVNGRFFLAGSFSAKLDKVAADRQTSELALRDAIIRRDELKRQLESIPPSVQADDAVQILASRSGGNTIDGRIADAERALDGMLLQYTDKHPDVVATRRLLESLKKQRKDSPGGVGGGLGRANPLYESVKILLIEADTSVAGLQRKVVDSKLAEEENRKLMEEAPRIEAELKDLDRDYEVLKSNYDTLLARRESARLSQAQEAETSTVQFRIIDPPHLPISATSPKRSILYAVVLIFGLGAGAGIAFVRGSFEDNFVSSAQLGVFGLPVLGRISQLVTAMDEIKARKDNWRFGLAAGSLVGSFAIVVLAGPYLVTIASRLGAGGLSSLLGGGV